MRAGDHKRKREGTRKALGTDLTLTSPLIYVVPGDPKGSRWEAPPSGAKEGGVTMCEISYLLVSRFTIGAFFRKVLFHAFIGSKALNHVTHL